MLKFKSKMESNVEEKIRRLISNYLQSEKEKQKELYEFASRMCGLLQKIGPTLEGKTLIKETIAINCNKKNNAGYGE